MREIIFRAVVFDDDNETSLRYNVWPVGDKVYVEHGGFWMRYESIHQFTGLKDKNGKEIYEGDVVRLFHGHPSWLTDPFEVVFQCSAFALKKKDKKGSTAFATYLHDCVTNGIISNDDDESALFEVIGNIHENADLIQ